MAIAGRRARRSVAATVVVAALWTWSAADALAQPAAGTKAPSIAPARTLASDDFPAELVNWKPVRENPVFTAEGPGHWDVKIRERGWILRNGDKYQLWFTGYDGTREGTKMLGYATSRDGVHWTRWPKNPIYRDRWVEDVMVVCHDGNYFMFAEGKSDNHAEMLTSENGIDWKWHGLLDVREADGKTPARRPCGTPTVWIEGDDWYLLYEWLDQGVWLATTKDPMSLVWTNVRDDPVLSPGPDKYDQDLIAVNQVVRYKDAYYAIYHGSGSGDAVPRTWNTNLARSTDRVHWTKYRGNPIVDDNKSSGVLVPRGQAFRLYTMHDRVDLFESTIR